MFDFFIEIMKENKIELKLDRNLNILKNFNRYIKIEK